SLQDLDVLSLLSLFSSWLTFHDVADPLLAMCICWTDGTADIWAPRNRPGIVLHEICHALRGSALLCLHGSEAHRILANVLREETACTCFAEAMLAPRPVLRE